MSHVNFLVPTDDKLSIEAIALNLEVDTSVIWRRIVKNGLRQEGIKEAIKNEGE